MRGAGALDRADQDLARAEIAARRATRRVTDRLLSSAFRHSTPRLQHARRVNRIAECRRRRFGR